MEPDIYALRDPDFWRQAWEEARKSSPYVKKRFRDEKEAIEFWNKLAPTYEFWEQERLEMVIGLLEQEKFLTPETEILDVGCGPGTYALPLARRVRSVTALDGAREMCRVLEQKAKEEKLHNITVLQRMWEDVELEKEGMVNSFDLVFASMTPAVCNYETLIKLKQASRKFCCLISWGGTFTQAHQELSELLFKKNDNGPGFLDIIFPFNILSSMGYYPTVRYFSSGWVKEKPVEQAIESLFHSFRLNTKITPEVKDTIAKYVQERAVNGVFCQETRVRLGMMTWRVDEQLRK